MEVDNSNFFQYVEMVLEQGNEFVFIRLDKFAEYFLCKTDTERAKILSYDPPEVVSAYQKLMKAMIFDGVRLPPALVFSAESRRLNSLIYSRIADNTGIEPRSGEVEDAPQGS